MKKRLMMALAAGALVAAMLPGVAAARPGVEPEQLDCYLAVPQVGGGGGGVDTSSWQLISGVLTAAKGPVPCADDPTK